MKMVDKRFWQRGEPFVWLTGGALTLTLFITGILLAVVMYNGLGVFWPSSVARLELHDGKAAIGEVKQREQNPEGGRRLQLKTGNRDLYSLDFRWIDEKDILDTSYPADITVLERMEYGNFYGFLKELKRPGVSSEVSSWAAFQAARDEVAEMLEQVEDVNKEISAINGKLERIQMKMQKLAYKGVADDAAEMVELEARAKELKGEFSKQVGLQTEMHVEIAKHKVVFADANGRTREIEIAEIVRAYRPNAMSKLSKAGFYIGKLGELFFDEPRESNTEGGLFPAIYGTVMLVFLMSFLSFPLGVLSGIYLREYAKEGPMLKLVRIAVNNLAGIPSIVFGVFGLGFFIYGVGGAMDRAFFPERLPTPTFGTGGLLWASMTLGLLTVPVVIVATEEALGAVPRAMREASLSLGATKFQTIAKVLLPMSSPGIMTGFILAMARAAGEVAPLMITGVVKLAPSLPLDADYPFLHLDRKFMHLGFHIYDIGFQSPNVEAAKPMVFVTTLLLVLIVLVMSSTAIHLRNKMKERYTIKGL